MADAVIASPSATTTTQTNETLDALKISESSRTSVLGTDNVRFNLTDIYTGIDDPQIAADLAQVEKLYTDFDQQFRGKLSTDLGSAMEAWEQFDRLTDKLFLYVSLIKSCNSTDQNIQSLAGKIQQSVSAAYGNHFAFVDIEIGAIEEATYQSLRESDPRVQRYAPRINRIREDYRHLLSEEVERALIIRAPFGSNEWNEYLNERTARTKYSVKGEVFAGEEIDGKALSQQELINSMFYNPRREVRAELARIFNDGLADERAPLMARALNLVIGRKGVDDKERGYTGIMSSRNRDNMISDEVVDSLHNAVADVGTVYTQRFYKLVAAHIGVDTLLWSDRNVRIGKTESITPWGDAVALVREAYQSFSPKLAGMVDEIFDKGRVDAPLYEGKNGGAFNMSCVLPEPLGARSYIFVNYQGQATDISTLAHELGHGVHGMIAGARQGSLMCSAPIAYCETASIFAEMVTFEFVKARMTSPEERLALLMEKIGDFTNSVVRQISFSEFEKRIHEQRKGGKITTDQFDRHWMDVTESFYGKPGEVFTYENTSHLWSYISHFMRPFYVYGYAFGELLTQSLFAVKDSYGTNFEPLYLELLAAGGTKDAKELLRPFGLNPEDPSFWLSGMHASVGKWLDEAETLSRQIGVLKS